MVACVSPALSEVYTSVAHTYTLWNGEEVAYEYQITVNHKYMYFIQEIAHIVQHTNLLLLFVSSVCLFWLLWYLDQFLEGLVLVQNLYILVWCSGGLYSGEKRAASGGTRTRDILHTVQML